MLTKMLKKLLITISLIIFLLLVNFEQPFSQGPKNPPGSKFAPTDANYVVTNTNNELLSEVLTTELPTNLIASGTRNLGDIQLPWNKIFGNIGYFSDLQTQVVSLSPLSNDPSDARSGQIYYNGATNKFRGFEDGMWKDLIGGSSVASAHSVTTTVKTTPFSLSFDSDLFIDVPGLELSLVTGENSILLTLNGAIGRGGFGGMPLRTRILADGIVVGEQAVEWFDPGPHPVSIVVVVPPREGLRLFKVQISGMRETTIGAANVMTSFSAIELR